MSLPSAPKILTPHLAQRDLVYTQTRYTICRAGRRSGKTVGLSILAVLAMCQGQRVLYVAPDISQTDYFWREVTRAFASMGDFAKINQSRRIILLPTGGSLRARSTWIADNLRGDYADLLLMDEWQLMPPEVWSEICAPMLVDTGGAAVFCYTPPSLRSRRRTTNPRNASQMFRAAQSDPDWTALHFSSHQNPHIDSGAIESLSAVMSATAIRQEIMAEDIEEAEGALWTRQQIRYQAAPSELVRVVVGVDPSGTTTGDSVGIVVAGIDEDDTVYVMEDASVRGLRPDEWSRAVVSAYHRHQADRVVAEVNYGGDMVEHTIRTADPDVSYRSVSASRGKRPRAEPVAALYERGRVYHVSEMRELEDEMCLWLPGYADSPDHMDAMVWAVTELALARRATWEAI